MPQTQSNHRSPRPSRPARRRAFTLIQVLVAIGIIVVLMAILVPTVITARKQALRTRQSLDLQAITTALEAFKADHGEYPSNQFLESLTLMDATNNQIVPNKLDVQQTGSELLGYCLLGVGPAAEDKSSAAPFAPGQFITAGGTYLACIKSLSTGTPAASDIDHWWPVVLPYWDNANGGGFRTQPPVAGTEQGKKFGPYLDATRFKLRGLQILDQWDHPILYFPANPARPDVHRPPLAPVAAGYIESVPNPSGLTNPRQPRQALWDAAYGVGTNVSAIDATPTYSLAFQIASTDKAADMLARFEVSMGDLNYNGYMDAGDGTPVTKDYILWSAGPDGYFGYNEPSFNAGPSTAVVSPTAVGSLKNFDDVTNFRE